MEENREVLVMLDFSDDECVEEEGGEANLPRAH